MKAMMVLGAALALTLASALAQEGKTTTFPLVDPQTDDPVLKPIFDGMRARGAGPLHIHRTIGHAPEIYKGFAAFATALRQPGATSRGDRELIILRTTQLRKGDYEFAQHRRIGLTCGLTEAQVDGLADWKAKSVYSPRQQMILAFADAMVADGEVSDDLLARVKQTFSPKEIVELAMNSAFYTAVVQFSTAVRVEPETETTSYAGC
ncbi:hypothetical protein VQ02_13800 [Methylobacterium variabile]|uniref:Carboxymuconolactone decarboxylase-like domain-containing protein n=2 Tax=Methylobacterium variabile TaxID=298794 RepID=A0A0J6SPS4_9HYPH|nr:hypothetical protein VQ02_13800 [Methylobacterium variabile]